MLGCLASKPVVGLVLVVTPVSGLAATSSTFPLRGRPGYSKSHVYEGCHLTHVMSQIEQSQKVKNKSGNLD